MMENAPKTVVFLGILCNWVVKSPPPAYKERLTKSQNQPKSGVLLVYGGEVIVIFLLSLVKGHV